MKKLAHIIFFCSYTYIIANSLFFAIFILYPESILYLGYIIIALLIFQYPVLLYLAFADQTWILNLFFFVAFSYETALFSYPLWLWWKKRTVFRAWLLAMAGAFSPGYLALLYISYLNYPYILLSLPVMTITYLLVWTIINKAPEYFHKNQYLMTWMSRVRNKCEIPIKKFTNFILFCLITYVIANSLLFVLIIYFIWIGEAEFCWEISWEIIRPLNSLNDFFQLPSAPAWLEKPSLALVYESAILFFPVLLWWRKRTVWRAWLVAMAGCLLPPYLYLYISFRPEIIEYSPFIITAAYFLIWVIIGIIQKYQAKYKKISDRSISNEIN